MIDLALFRSRTFGLAVLTAVLHHIGRAGVVVLMPCFLIEARGASLLETSDVMVTIPITLIAVAPVSGSLADRHGPRVLTTAAQAIPQAIPFVASWSRGGHHRPIQGGESSPERTTSGDREWHGRDRPRAAEHRDGVRPALTSDERSNSNER